MKILIALPDLDYFLWQVIVQMNNFKKYGLLKDTIYVVGIHVLPSANLQRIMRSNPGCQFVCIKDTRKGQVDYSSTLRPHILAKYFTMNPDVCKNAYLYMDPDVVFTKQPDYQHLLNDNIWYLSDTRSYIDSNYIKSKSSLLFREMCNIVGISPEAVEAQDDNAGGAQYLMKNLTAEFWMKVERDAELLYRYMISTEKLYSPEHPIQSWTADMWAVLWNAWLSGYQTKIVKDLDFCWATDLIIQWEDTGIYHNAGAVVDDGNLFLKTKHQVSPFNKDLKASDVYCSFNYVKEIREAEINYNTILF